MSHLLFIKCILCFLLTMKPGIFALLLCIDTCFTLHFKSVINLRNMIELLLHAEV